VFFVGVCFWLHSALAANNLVLYLDAVFHTALDNYAEDLPPVLERCTMYLEYFGDGHCGMLDASLLSDYILARFWHLMLVELVTERS